MDDFAELESLTGAEGQLDHAARACSRMNDALTMMMEGAQGTDGTDTFDASCNTCRHFVRAGFDRNKTPSAIWGFPGMCAKFGRPTVGQRRGLYCGIENGACYENRRTGKGGFDFQ